MLKKVDYHKKMEKQEYKNVIDELEIKIGQLQRKALDAYSGLN